MTGSMELAISTKGEDGVCICIYQLTVIEKSGEKRALIAKMEIVRSVVVLKTEEDERLILK